MEHRHIRYSAGRRIGVVFAVVFASLTCASAQAIVELRHAHGIGYSADGRQILVPNHYGIAVFSEGRWSKVPGPANDYMGFVVTRDFIFTSGHLAGSRGAANPLGLIRSSDAWLSWTTLAFGGAVEFHLVAAGYFSNAVYVYNDEPNAAMPRTAIYRMMGERLVGWRPAAGRGLEGGGDAHRASYGLGNLGGSHRRRTFHFEKWGR